MNIPVKMQTTRYGLSPGAGGWDSPGDSGTDQFRGDGIPGDGFFVLNRSACALTVSAEDALARTLLEVNSVPATQMLRLPLGSYLLVTYPNAPIFNRVCILADRAPEDDMRLDIFLPYHDDPIIPDDGFVQVLTVPPFTLDPAPDPALD